MKGHDLGTSLFWLFLSTLVCIESLRLGIGTFRNPGTGFMAFGTSGLLGILSILLFLQTSFKKERIKTGPLFTGKLWKRVLLVVIALVIYSRSINVIGYLISTFLLMSLLFWIIRGQKWWWILISSFLTTVVTFFVFSKWLNCQFPAGLFGF